MKEVAGLAQSLVANVERVIVGKRGQITLSVVALLAEGHMLIEDVPGVAKTMLARALAISSGCSFSRLQCTPDLLPTDITGASIFNQKTTEFEFRPGPIFSEVVLADEINRATPRTQSALLEAMGERQVTVDGVTHPTPQPFMLIATQNPIEHEGTFPLPEAQLDRFLIRLSIGYPGALEEAEMLERLQLRHPIETLEAVTSPEEVTRAQKATREVHVEASVREYILNIIRGTRDTAQIQLGASPRASLALLRASQALAAVRQRDFIIPDDVKQLATHVLQHRIILNPESLLRKVSATKLVKKIIDMIPAPVVTRKPEKV
jgi:MoxR-like ATPase